MAATDGPAHAGASAASDSLPDVASFVDQAAALLEIQLDSAWHSSVVAAFTSYRDAATLLMEFPVVVDVEQASVYTLGDPNDDH
jgi:hypothetical protein